MRLLRSGFTLIELVVTIGIMTLIAIGAGMAFDAAFVFQNRVPSAGEEIASRHRFEDKLLDLLSHVYLNADSEGEQGHFIAASSDLASLSGEAGTLPDTLYFTIGGKQPKGAYLAATGEFEELHVRFGPQGGVAEASISLVPVGETERVEGLFLREQRPPDGDPFQGGYEETFDSRIESIGFEFWDGTAWVAEWDSTSMGEPRLPAAIRASYRFRDDPEGETRSLIARVRLSDVTPENPAGVGGGATP